MKARDEAVLRALKMRPWKEDALVAVLPVETPPLNPEEQRRALASVLTRLRVKALIYQGEGGWRVTT